MCKYWLLSKKSRFFILISRFLLMQCILNCRNLQYKVYRATWKNLSVFCWFVFDSEASKNSAPHKMYKVRCLSFCRFFKHLDHAFFGGHAPKNDDKRHLHTLLVETNQYFHPTEVGQDLEKIAQKGSFDDSTTNREITHRRRSFWSGRGKLCERKKILLSVLKRQ